MSLKICLNRTNYNLIKPTLKHRRYIKALDIILLVKSEYFYYANFFSKSLVYTVSLKSILF